MSGLYIHIPFCKSRCIYCDFYSTTFEGRKDDYVDALIAEIKLRKVAPHILKTEETHQTSASSAKELDISAIPWQTIYIGGGTPSRLNERQLTRLFDNIDYSRAREITMECNPDDITPEYAEMLSSLPVNRVSMGIQTFSDERLRFLHRRHNAQQAATAVNLLRQVGISNISLDLMYGFPGETLDEWQSDIDHLLALRPEHISAYALMYEEGTPLFGMLEKGEISEIDDEQSRAMYEFLMDKTAAAGFEHYEISNFARPGFRSLHNSSYWNDTPYLGIGAAAHSYDGTVRSWNTDNIENYIATIKQGELPSESEILTKEDKYNDSVMLSLRTCEGIDIKRFEERFGASATSELLAKTQRFIGDSLITKTESDTLRLTRDGLFVSDMIIRELFI